MASTTSVDGVRIQSADANPSTVQPDGTITVSVVLAETATWVAPGDNDLCDPSGFSQTGLLAEVTGRASWGEQHTETACVPVYAAAQGDREVQFEFRAPDNAGNYGITLELRLPGSGSGPKSTQIPIAVETFGDPGCGSDSECPSGQVCVDGECVDEDSNGGSDPVDDVQGTLDRVVLIVGGVALIKGLGFLGGE